MEKDKGKRKKYRGRGACSAREEYASRISMTRPHKEVIYYGVTVPASVPQDWEAPLFEEVGDPLLTNLVIPNRIPWAEAVVYRIRIGLRPLENITVRDVEQLIYFGRLKMDLSRNPLIDTQLSYMPCALFPGTDQEGAYSGAAGIDALRRDISRELEVGLLRPLALPFHVTGFAEGNHLSGAIRFVKSFENSKPATLDVILDVFAIDPLR